MPTASASKLRTARLAECSCVMGGAADEAEPIIRRVKVLGPESRNGRRYLEEAIARAAPLYEGAVVYWDHPTKVPDGWPVQDRPAIAKFGRLENVRLEEGCLWADLRYNPDHLYAGTVLGWVRSDPSMLGLSHNAVGRIREGADGEPEVEEIVSVDSVDLVADPATTSGLFESTSPSKDTTTMNPDDLLAPEQPTETGAADSDAGNDDNEKSIADHLGELAAKIVGDETMDSATKLKKLKAALKVLEDESAEDAADDKTETEDVEEGDEDDKDDEMKKTEESVRRLKNSAADRLLEAYRKVRAKAESYELREAREKARLSARRLCVAAGLPTAAITETFLASMAEARSDEARKALVDDRKSILGVPRRPTAAPTPRYTAAKKLTADDLLSGM